jgi:hypothetical protein
MLSQSPGLVAEFIQHYSRDAAQRWSPADRQAQQDFVNRHLAGRRWLDWSTETAGLELWQASGARLPLAVRPPFEALLLAGPIVELADAAKLFDYATGPVLPGGHLIGILPCLRDNSPESQLFMDLAAAGLWPYSTAEELVELLGDTGWQLASDFSGFIAIPRFQTVVLNGQLAFAGFQKIFAQLIAHGYDPMEVGWGELRFVARLDR